MNVVQLTIFGILIFVSLVLFLYHKHQHDVYHKPKNTLYPNIEPYATFLLPTSDGKWNIYVEQVGNPNGTPILFLHGGPGTGISPYIRRFFDPDKFRIILFDQRGAKKSRPKREELLLTNNTTWDLVNDIESIRKYLCIDSWHIFGGSWGSSLALIYSILHPLVVKSLILRGVFLARPIDIDWYHKYGANQIFAQAWETFIEPVTNKQNPIAEYAEIFASRDNLLIQKSAAAWTIWDLATSYFPPRAFTIQAVEEFDVTGARILCHYELHNFFLPTDNWILENISILSRQQIPIRIIQGQFDFVCPMAGALKLYNYLKAFGSNMVTLDIVKNAGHSVTDPPIISTIVTCLGES